MTLVGRLLLACALTTLNACAAEERAPGVATTSTALPPVTPTVRACRDGEEKACRNYLIDDNGTIDCFAGTRVCVDGGWSACEGSSKVSETAGTCSIDAPIEATVGTSTTPDAVAVRLEDGSIAVDAGDAFASFPIKLAASSREFHLPYGAVDLSLRIGGIAVPIVLLKIDGRVAASCDRLDTIAVVAIVPESAAAVVGDTLGTAREFNGVRGFAIALTGQTEEK